MSERKRVFRVSGITNEAEYFGNGVRFNYEGFEITVARSKIKEKGLVVRFGEEVSEEVIDEIEEFSLENRVDLEKYIRDLGILLEGVDYKDYLLVDPGPVTGCAPVLISVFRGVLTVYDWQVDRRYRRGHTWKNVEEFHHGEDVYIHFDGQTLKNTVKKMRKSSL